MKILINTVLSVALSVTAIVASSLGANAASPTLEKIKSEKALTIGHRESSIPFSYLDNDQKPVGFSLDLCAAIVERLTEEIGVGALDINYVAVNSSNRIPLIKNGTVDIECGGTANNLTRQKEVSFSVATFVSQPRWLSPASAGVKSVDDLKGQVIVTTQGSNAVGFAQAFNQQDNLDLNIVQAKDHTESFLMITSGRAKAFLEDDILLAGLKANASDPDSLVFLPEAYDKIYYGLMFQKDDTEFKAIVDGVLTEMMASGEFSAIYDKWFTQPIPPKGMNLQFPMSEALQERVKHPSDQVEN